MALYYVHGYWIMRWNRRDSDSDNDCINNNYNTSILNIDIHIFINIFCIWFQIDVNGVTELVRKNPPSGTTDYI